MPACWNIIDEKSLTFHLVTYPEFVNVYLIKNQCVQQIVLHAVPVYTVLVKLMSTVLHELCQTVNA